MIVVGKSAACVFRRSWLDLDGKKFGSKEIARDICVDDITLVMEDDIKLLWVERI